MSLFNIIEFTRLNNRYMNNENKDKDKDNYMPPINTATSNTTTTTPAYPVATTPAYPANNNLTTST